MYVAAKARLGGVVSFLPYSVVNWGAVGHRWSPPLFAGARQARGEHKRRLKRPGGQMSRVPPSPARLATSLYPIMETKA